MTAYWCIAVQATGWHSLWMSSGCISVRRLAILTYFVVFLSYPSHMLRWYFKIGHNNFLPHVTQLIVNRCRNIRHFMMRAVEKSSLNNPRIGETTLLSIRLRNLYRSYVPNCLLFCHVTCHMSLGACMLVPLTFLPV